MNKSGKDLANSTGNAAGAIVKVGEETVKKHLLDSVIPPKASQNHRNRTVHIHDMEYYSITYNCIGIRVADLIGTDARSFGSALRSLSRAIVWLTNIQSGGIGFLDFDTDMAAFLDEKYSDTQAVEDIREFFYDLNCFTRKGCEKPYVTFNFGLNTSDGGRRVTKLLLEAYSKGDERGNPFIFPNMVFKLKKETNVSENAPNYDLYQKALSVTARRMVPTYFNCDSPANRNAPSNKIGIMGCRTRVVSNIYGEDSGLNRGNIACVTMNLVQMAFHSNGSLEKFLELIGGAMEDSKNLLLHRFETLASNADFSEMKMHSVYLDQDKADVHDMLKNGTLSIGFIGLWDALSVLHEKKWNSVEDMLPFKDEAFSIVKFMRERTDDYTQKNRLNFSLLASAAEGVSGSFAEHDSACELRGSEVCQKGYYTNSFHIPVFIEASYIEKVDMEAAFHELCNGGSITYVEMEEMPGRNVEAVQEVVEYAWKKGCNYIGINFPLDNCNDCGFTGRISGSCPKCSSENIRRLRRVSGYLAEEDRFTNGKKLEMQQRTPHAKLF